MFARGRSKERSSTRKVTPPSPSYMSNEQFAAYLADLRNNRVNRPAGARPPPASSRPEGLGISVNGRPSFGDPSPSTTSLPQHPSHQRTQSDTGSHPPNASRVSIAPSVSSRYSTIGRGKDYYPDQPVQPLKPSDVVPTATYIERGQRWMEKEEAVSLRRAMEDMDLKYKTKAAKDGEAESDEEKRIYNAALDEAAELVWQHQNPGKLPQPGAPYRYRPHLRKNSYAHARTASVGRYGSDVAPTGLARDRHSSSPSGSSSEDDGPESVAGRPSFASSCQTSSREPAARPLPTTPGTSRNTKSYGDISTEPGSATPGRSRSRQKRNMSGEVAQKLFSGDQIWEEPDSEMSGQPQGSARNETANPLQPKTKDPLNWLQSTLKAAAETKTDPAPSPEKVVSKYEIHRNPPSQSRNPQYTTNPRVATLSVQREDVPRKHGMEIRSDDIKQATSMKLKDRSSKLPTPSAVSDSPGRPIKSPDSGKEAPATRPASPPVGSASSSHGSKRKRSLLSLLRAILRPRRRRHGGHRSAAHNPLRPVFK
ncbi:hypothetical protein VTI74DRAFT_9823 [Chaetomium olivicolor]